MKILTRPDHPRQAWALEQAGVHPLLARLYAARGVQSAAELQEDLSALLPPSDLKGIDAAITLLSTARAEQTPICIVADYDCDGATACAVLLRGLCLLGFNAVDFLVPDRVVDGYGLTPASVSAWPPPVPNFSSPWTTALLVWMGCRLPKI